MDTIYRLVLRVKIESRFLDFVAVAMFVVLVWTLKSCRKVTLQGCRYYFFDAKKYKFGTLFGRSFWFFGPSSSSSSLVDSSFRIRAGQRSNSGAFRNSKVFCRADVVHESKYSYTNKS